MKLSILKFITKESCDSVGEVLGAESGTLTFSVSLAYSPFLNALVSDFKNVCEPAVFGALAGLLFTCYARVCLKKICSFN